MRNSSRLMLCFTLVLLWTANAFSQGQPPPAPKDRVISKPLSDFAQWQALTVAEANFKAELPGKPFAAAQTVESPMGKVPLRTWTLRFDIVQYVLLVGEYPIVFDTPDSVKHSLDGARDLTLSQAAGKLISDTEISYGKFPGRDWKALTDRGLIRTRMYLVHNRMYALQAVLPESAENEEGTQKAVNRFLNSFKLLREPTELPAGIPAMSQLKGNTGARGLFAKLSERPVGWREFASAQYGYKLQVPGEPEERTLLLNPNDPRLAVQLLAARGEKIVCLALTQRLPGGANEAALRELIFNDLLNSLSEGFAKGAKGEVKLLSQTKINLQGHPGQEYNLRIENAAGVVGRGAVRSYVIGDTIYMLNGLAFGAETDATEVSRFLDSFTVPNLPPPPALASEQVFTSTAGNYSVKLPGIHSEGVLPLDTPLGKVDMRFVTGEATGGVYAVIYSDFPAFGSSEEFIDGVLQGLKQAPGVQMLISLKDTLKTEFGEYPGRLASLKLPTGQTTQERFYLVEGRLYQLRVVGGSNTEAPLTPEAFFGSFKLLQNPATVAPPPPPPPPKPAPSRKASSNFEPPPMPPPPMPKLREELIPSDAAKVSGGILQGVLATKKVEPEYPPIAKAARADGPVAIQVLLSENGELRDAVVLTGHPLLRDAALAAARQWQFKAHQVNGKAVKAVGILVFNFTLQ